MVFLLLNNYCMNSTALRQQVETCLDTYFPQFEPALKEELSRHALIREFPAGKQLMSVGQYIKSTLLIVNGLVKLYREDDQGHEFFIYHLAQGDACALSMICAARQEKSELQARTVEPTTALLIPVELMDQLMQRYKSWYYFVLETYRKRFEELLEVTDSIAFKSMDQRLEVYLRNQQKMFKSAELPLSHQQIATDLNSSREVISRLLKKMEQQGMVKLGRNTITFL
jgi:CRP/FNR family transcriptional regulator